MSTHVLLSHSAKVALTWWWLSVCLGVGGAGQVGASLWELSRQVTFWAPVPFVGCLSAALTSPWVSLLP